MLNVKTFDAVTFRSAQLYENFKGGCPVTFVQDCSSRGLFSVTSSSVSNTDSRLKLLVPNAEIEIVRHHDKWQTITVNGVEKRIPTINEPLLIKEDNDER